MEILMIIIGVLAVVSMIAFLIHLFIKAYNKDQQEQDERILQLEKRIQEQYSNIINDYKDKIINLNIEQSDLEKRIQKLERKKKSDKEI